MPTLRRLAASEGSRNATQIPGEINKVTTSMKTERMDLVSTRSFGVSSNF